MKTSILSVLGRVIVPLSAAITPLLATAAVAELPAANVPQAMRSSAAIVKDMRPVIVRVAAARKNVDPYTDGAVGTRTPDPWADGGHGIGKPDPYTDGAYGTRKPDPYTDGARTGSEA
ncbi:hypothetical protein SAMN05216345_105152 [Cupriavidus sp. YR651]|uniref:hypothetical protein n=1 Tax=Cupriavidus sp. YR651 TaxID=1855315 RepID=UPI00089049BB|nr:hypothetical protein [Cupriavidus sp. YR651]SDD00079.1 hypothetical protein SAMN05216345_105152 [Cupriavidus sp. YR651]